MAFRMAEKKFDLIGACPERGNLVQTFISDRTVLQPDDSISALLQWLAVVKWPQQQDLLAGYPLREFMRRYHSPHLNVHCQTSTWHFIREKLELDVQSLGLRASLELWPLSCNSQWLKTIYLLNFFMLFLLLALCDMSC